MRITKKNSQKRQNYYKHNKKSQKRHMKGGGGGEYEGMDQESTFSYESASTSNGLKGIIAKLERVDGNSREVFINTGEDKEIGSGQFGIVQKRCRKRFFREEKCYAVKSLKIGKELDDEANKKLLEDLTREVKIQRELTMKGKKKIGNENYIAQYIAHSITTAFDSNGKKIIEPYLAMSFYEKGSLDKLDHFDGKELYEKSGNKIKKFIKQLCQGLNYMNKKNISHNDIAARNVLIAKVGEEYQPRITDFGLAMEVTTNPTVIIRNKYPVLEGAPEISSEYIYKNSDVYSAAILLSNIIFNYHYFQNLINKKGEDYEWKNLLKQAPFNRYPKPFSISNIKQMYRKIGEKEDNLTKGQPYVDLIINERYLNEDYSNNSIIATIFEDDTFRKAKCFRYESTLRSNMEQLCELFNLEGKKFPALNKDVFNYLKNEHFADGAKSVSIVVPKSAEPIVSESIHGTLDSVLGTNKAEAERARAEAARAAAQKNAKLIKNLKTKAETKKNIESDSNIISIEQLKSPLDNDTKNLINNYLKYKIRRSKKKRRELFRKILSKSTTTTGELTTSTAGGARTNKKKFNKKYSKKSKKNYTINKKRTHKRK